MGAKRLLQYYFFSLTPFFGHAVQQVNLSIFLQASVVISHESIDFLSEFQHFWEGKSTSHFPDKQPMSEFTPGLMPDAHTPA